MNGFRKSRTQFLLIPRDSRVLKHWLYVERVLVSEVASNFHGRSSSCSHVPLKYHLGTDWMYLRARVGQLHIEEVTHW